MNRVLNFSKRNLKELLRDPLIYVFCLGFPIVMLILFYFINSYSQGNTPTFEIRSLLPGIITFSYSFIMLAMGLLVSKDRQTFFLKRLYSSPMKSHDFILGYAVVGFIVGLCQTLVCVLAGFVFSLINGEAFICFSQVVLLALSQIPMLVTNVFLGLLFGTILSDKSAPGLCSVFISASGILGGCWMPLETMGGFESFCRFLPFYPSVYIGRVITNATNALNQTYVFDKIAWLGLIPIGVFMILSVVASFIVFKNNMTSDK